MERILGLMKRAHQGDKEARDTIVSENLGLVWSIVKRFMNRGVDLEDLFQIGCIGLLKAVDKFNLEYQVKFSTYAVPMIAGEIRRFLRDDGMIKVSRSLKRRRTGPVHRGSSWKKAGKRTVSFGTFSGDGCRGGGAGHGDGRIFSGRIPAADDLPWRRSRYRTDG